jgi:hypothetical protein
MIYPRFGAETFWNFGAPCEPFGAKYPTAPLGLITVAALLPLEWTVRLVDCNTENLADGDLDWADMVMTGGMLPQYFDTVEVIDLCRARGKPVAIRRARKLPRKKLQREGLLPMKPRVVPGAVGTGNPARARTPRF